LLEAPNLVSTAAGSRSVKGSIAITGLAALLTAHPMHPACCHR